VTGRARRPVTVREGVVLHPEPLRGDPALVAEVDALVRAATRHVDCAARIAALEHALREVLATAAEAGTPWVVAMARAQRVLDADTPCPR